MLVQQQDAQEHVQEIESLTILEFALALLVTKQMLQQLHVLNVIIDARIVLMLQSIVSDVQVIEIKILPFAHVQVDISMTHQI